jgi:hypothetical protein
MVQWFKLTNTLAYYDMESIKSVLQYRPQARRGSTTLGITTLSIMTFSLKINKMPYIIMAEHRYA